MSSPLETENHRVTFQRYAGKDGNSYTCSQTEFLTFMKTELAAFTKDQKNPGILDRMRKKLDINCDGKLDYQESLDLIGGLALACHVSFSHCQKYI